MTAISDETLSMLVTANQRARSERERYARMSLDAIDDLRRDLDAMEDAIRAAASGGAAYTDRMVPSHQRIMAVVENGAAFRALWTTTGVDV